MRLPLPSTVGCWTFGSRLPRSRRARESFVWGIALTFAAGACAAQEVTIAVSRASLSLPVWVADSLKLFANEGLPVTTRECVGGHRCIKLMLDGEVPLATAAEMPVMLNSLARSDFAIVATFVTSKRDIKLIARRSAGIKTASDLRGKRLGTVQGTSAHYFLDGLLLFNAIDPHGVELVPLAPEQIPAALSEGQIAAAAIWEPFANRSIRALGADAVVIPSAGIYTETFNLLATRAFIAEREPDLVKVLRALSRAQRFIREQPQQAQAILRERLQEDQSFVDATWRDFDYRMSLNQPLVSTLEGEARWAVREGHARRDSRIPNFVHFVAPESLRRVDPDAVTLVIK